MSEWSPELRLRTYADRCRLSLVNVTWGEGATLQEAANDLLTRVFDLAVGLRRSGFRGAAATRPDPRVSAYLWAAGDVVARGGDLRQWLFGPAGTPPVPR